MLYIYPMKVIQLLINYAFIQFGAFSVQAQSYTPMLDNTNEWHFTTCYSNCLTDIYYTNGDTIVNGKTYKVLDGFHYISRTFLIREDIAAKKVYMIIAQPGDIKFEIPLYDFAVQIGDTIPMRNPISPFPSEPGDFICDSIVLKPLVDGNKYRYFYFHPLDSIQASSTIAVWVEGVGSLSLINSPGGKPDINDVGNLSCFFKNGNQFYENLDSISECVPTIIPNSIPQTKKTNIKVALNNQSKSISIHNPSIPYSLQVFNIQGREIQSLQMITSKEYQLKMNELDTGILIIKIIQENGKTEIFKLTNL